MGRFNEKPNNSSTLYFAQRRKEYWALCPLPKDIENQTTPTKDKRAQRVYMPSAGHPVRADLRGMLRWRSPTLTK